MTMALSEKVVTASMFERQGTLQSRSGQGRADTEQGKKGGSHPERARQLQNQPLPF
jgi:hypothetical protein